MINRREFAKGGLGAFFIATTGRALGIGAASCRVRLAIVGCRAKGRGQAVLNSVMRVPGVEIAYVCDVDARARDWGAYLVEKATGFRPKKEKDLRKILEDKELDGIVSETPDHWHACSAVWAMRAGKAVYVEKPCAFCPRECEIVVDEWKRSGVVFQMGNQRRASLSCKAAIEYVRTTGAIGNLCWAKCWFNADRKSIGRGKVDAVPEWLDWELWQGPAPRREYRDNVVHYNWHWFRNWGTAETGNNAPHFADVARWALDVGFPSRVSCSGGLLADKSDDYEWPDTYDMSFAYPGGKFISFDLTSHSCTCPHMGIATGAMVYGEHGALLFRPDDSVALYDAKSKVVKEWNHGGATEVGSLSNPTSSLDRLHAAKFVDCIRANSQKTNSPADEAVKSSLMPLLANIALEIGEDIHLDPQTGELKTEAAKRLWAREYAKGWELA